jgi:hypothetical protein
MMNKVDGVVDVVGVQQGNPEVTWTVDPWRRAATVSPSSRCRTSWRATGSARWRPICACRSDDSGPRAAARFFRFDPTSCRAR